MLNLIEAGWQAIVSLVPRPTPVLWFALTVIHGCGRPAKNGEGLVLFIMCFMSGGRGGGGGGGGGGGPTANKFKNHRRSCVDCLRVSTSCGVFELSRLDDEQPWAPAEMTTDYDPSPLRPPRIHLTSLT